MAIATRSPSSFEDDPPEIQPGGGGAEPAAIRLSGVRKRFRKYTVRGGYSTLKTSLMNRMFRRMPLWNSQIATLFSVSL